MLSFLPVSVSVKAEGTVDNVVITYDESQVTFTTSMTAKEATALLVKSCFRLCLFPLHHIRLSLRRRREEMATHSSILAWETPWTEEPGGRQSIELQRVRGTQ